MLGPKPKDPVERFMNFVEFEPNTGCWLWVGGSAKGYGMFGIGSRSNNTVRMVRASRFSYETFVGPIPNGLDVLHKCDVRSCVNWEHLFLGTQQDNGNDMALKGRGTKSKKGLPYGVKIMPSGICRSLIHFKGKDIHLGYFGTAVEASKAATEKKLKLIEAAKTRKKVSK